MTGADTLKCQWIKDILKEHNVNFCGLQEHFKTVNSTHKWFSKQFYEFDNYVIPAYRMPGVDSGRGKGGLVQMSDKKIKVSKVRQISQSKRIQSQILDVGSFKIL